MKIRQIACVLVGSVVVFVACAAEFTPSSSTSTGEGAGRDSGPKDALAEATTRDDGASVFDAMAEAIGIDVYPVKDASADPAPVSGSRIKAVFNVVTSPDGAKSKFFSGWRDSFRNEDCSISTASDGTTRCLPTSALAINVGGYEDSACSRPILVAARSSGPCALEPKYWLTYKKVNTCGPLAPRYYQLGSELPKAPVEYWTSPAVGECVKATTAWPYNTTNWKFHSMSPEIDPSNFAPMAQQSVVE